jgi:hypothetical protein
MAWPMSAGGRPPTYQPAFAEQAEKLCLLGATDLELADFFGVDVRTVYRWKHDHPAFCQALKVGKEALDDRVERGLYQRAVGYSFNSEKVFHFQGHITRAETVEHVPPDPSAALSWLKNRRGEKWRDKQDIEHSGTVDHAHTLSDADLERIAKGLG